MQDRQTIKTEITKTKKPVLSICFLNGGTEAIIIGIIRKDALFSIDFKAFIPLGSQIKVLTNTKKRSMDNTHI
jgi:hypothetical protein